MSRDYRLMLPLPQACRLHVPTPLQWLLVFCEVELTIVDDSEGYEKPDMDNASSQIIMHYVTRRCLDFEARFGKYPGRYG